MTSRWNSRRLSVAVAGAATLAATFALAVDPPPAHAAPVSRQIRVADTDWTSGADGGIGDARLDGGEGFLTIAGVSGTVTGGYLAWHGIGGYDGDTGDYEGSYTSRDIEVDGQPVEGVKQGVSGSNCWGPNATSRTYVADVSDIVKAKGGNGTYYLAGLGGGGDADGAVLVVTFDDGDPFDNRDLYLFYGNDSDGGGFPGEDNVWDDALTGINYQGGQVNLQLAVADGQDNGSDDDGALNVSGDGGTVSFFDDSLSHGLWDGTTVRDEGVARAAANTVSYGPLFDLETFNVTGALVGTGTKTLQIDSQMVNDCHALVMAAVDVAATGDQPPGGPTVSVSPTSVVEGTVPGPHPTFTRMVFKVTLSELRATPTRVVVHTEDAAATAPADYRARTATVVIPAGRFIGRFKVNVVPDGVAEGDEDLAAVIDSASVNVVDDRAVGTIVDDD